jgi:RNA polymerase sigma-70 factor (ECF subfamily)
LSSRDAERLLSVLRGRQRDVIHAISIEGISTREAAARFRISEGAVRVALHRGLSALAAAHRGWDQ